MKYQLLKMVKTDIEVKTRGIYHTATGFARGVVIHYTAGRYKTPDVAENTLRYLASQNLGCMVLDRDGSLYVAKNQELNEVAYHAGHSSWQQVTGISNYCMGIEVVCAGKLNDTGLTWYGEQVKRDDCRRIDSQDKNQKPGLYHKFTKAQESALLNFCLWQLDTNPEFRTSWIVGHDEIAPDRKSDPGGSLALTMHNFRNVVSAFAGKEN